MFLWLLYTATKGLPFSCSETFGYWKSFTPPPCAALQFFTLAAQSPSILIFSVWIDAIWIYFWSMRKFKKTDPHYWPLLLRMRGIRIGSEGYNSFFWEGRKFRFLQISNSLIVCLLSFNDIHVDFSECIQNDSRCWDERATGPLKFSHLGWYLHSAA